MLNTNSTKLINFINIIQNPTNIVPLLSDREIHTIIIDSIKAYVDHEISLEIFVDIVTKLKLFSGITKDRNEKTNDALADLIELYNFIKKEQKYKNKIIDILIIALNKLSNPLYK